MRKASVELTEKIEYNLFDVGEEVEFTFYGKRYKGVVLSQDIPSQNDKMGSVRIKSTTGYEYNISTLNVTVINRLSPGNFVTSGCGIRFIIKCDNEIELVNKDFVVFAGGVPHDIDDKGFRLLGVRYTFLNKTLDVKWPDA